MMSDKIRRHHLDRRAIPYVRQSSSHQVLHNRESRALQSAMRERLVALGWSEIEIIDDDLGRSAAGSVLRAGFERMVAEVCFANADLSRLIRSGMTEVYSIRCGMPPDTSSTKQILVWNIYPVWGSLKSDHIGPRRLNDFTTLDKTTFNNVINPPSSCARSRPSP